MVIEATQSSKAATVQKKAEELILLVPTLLKKKATLAFTLGMLKGSRADAKANEGEPVAVKTEKKQGDDSESMYWLFLEACFKLMNAQELCVQTSTESIKSVTDQEQKWNEELKNYKTYFKGWKESRVAQYVDGKMQVLQSQQGTQSNLLQMLSNALRLTGQLSTMDIQAQFQVGMSAANWTVA